MSNLLQQYADGTIDYYFADTMTKQTTLPDGSTIHVFADGQVEKKQADGTREIRYLDGTIRFIFPDNEVSL